MNSISRSKHEHLKASMEELKLLLQEPRQTNCSSTCIDLELKKEQLNLLFEQYEMLLSQVAKTVQDYSNLSVNIKTELLGKHLKGMQKTMRADDPMYQHLHLAVHFLYSA